MAIRALDDWTSRSSPGLVIMGPRSSGKTHLASVWMNETGAEILQLGELYKADIDMLLKKKFVVLENVNKLSHFRRNEQIQLEEKILHIYNFCSSSGGKVLITATTFPKNWNILLKDLLSRFMSCQIAELCLPDDNLLAAIITKQFADRQIVVAPNVIEYAIARMERSFSFAKTLVEDLDSKALSVKKPISKKMVNDIIIKLCSKESEI